MAAVYVVCGDFHLGWIAPVAVAVAAHMAAARVAARPRLSAAGLHWWPAVEQAKQALPSSPGFSLAVVDFKCAMNGNMTS